MYRRSWAAVRRFPPRDRGVVSNQLRRAALSVHSNIAEGCGKSSRRETARILQIAAASAKETDSHLVIAGDLGLLHPVLSQQLIDQSRSIQRMLESLMRNIPWLATLNPLKRIPGTSMPIAVRHTPYAVR